MQLASFTLDLNLSSIETSFPLTDTSQIVQRIRRGVDDDAEFSKLFEHLMHLFNYIFWYDTYPFIRALKQREVKTQEFMSCIL